jgi:hypothetical protein
VPGGTVAAWPADAFVAAPPGICWLAMFEGPARSLCEIVFGYGFVGILVVVVRFGA